MSQQHVGMPNQSNTLKNRFRIQQRLNIEHDGTVKYKKFGLDFMGAVFASYVSVTKDMIGVHC